MGRFTLANVERIMEILLLSTGLIISLGNPAPPTGLFLPENERDKTEGLLVLNQMRKKNSLI